MKKAVSLILLICFMLSILPSYASDDTLNAITDIYLDKEELSVWEALGLALNGNVVPESYYDALGQDILQRDGVYRTALEYAKIAILLKQDNKNPKDFYGYDIISSIANFKDIDKSGINGVIFSIFALVDVDIENDTVWNLDKLLDLLLGYQNTDGGFPLAKGWGSDNDLTAMAVSALSYYKDNNKAETALSSALGYLSSKLDSDGFMYYQNSDSSENLSQMIIALSSANISLSDERFIRNGKTVYDTLLEKYMTEDGKFKHSFSATANTIATEQAYLALSSMKYGYVYAYKEHIEEPVELPDEPEPVPSENEVEDIIPEPEIENMLPFPDEPEVSSQYYDDLVTAYELSLVSGDTSGKLRPLDYLTKAEACVLLYKAAGLETDIFIPRYSDVKKADWYSKYVIGCYFNGVVLQSGNVLFQPNENIKTEDFEKSINVILGADVTYSDELYITRQKAISMIIESIKEGGK